MKRKETKSKPILSRAIHHQPFKGIDKSKPENMEGHRHSTIHHKNKWKDYLFEFLMLFLAVTAGFFVETQREHSVEKIREKQFMRSMIQDLKSDIVLLNSNIESRYKYEGMVDSFVILLNSLEYRKYGNEIYFLGRTISLPLYFFPNDRTIQQLKNSGNLRLIRNMAVSDSIMFYDQKMRNIQFQFTDEREIKAEYRQVAKKYFNGFEVYLMLNKNNPLSLNKPTHNPSLFKSTAEGINELTNQAQYIKNVTRFIRRWEEDLKNLAGRLIQFLKKEYDFEDE